MVMYSAIRDVRRSETFGALHLVLARPAQGAIVVERSARLERETVKLVGEGGGHFGHFGQEARTCRV